MRATHRRGLSNAFLLSLIVALAVVAGVFAYLYFGILNTSKEAHEASVRLIGSVTGADKSLTKTLDPKFKDADGDLVADAPTDPSKLINPDTLVFSFISERPEESKADWKDFTEYLAKVTGKKVEYLLAPNSNEVLRALKEGRLHIAGLNTGSVPMAVNLTGFVPLYTMGAPGSEGYIHTEIIVPADSEIKTPADLKGHTIAFVELNSNSGCKAPMVMLKTQFNLLPEKDYQAVYSYGHERSIAGIADKTYQAAAVASDLLAHAAAVKAIDPKQYRTIYSSENYPAVTIGYEYNLAPELKEKIRSAFETFDFKGTTLEARFAPTKQDHFNPVNYKNDFKMVRLVDDQVGKPYVLH